MSDAFLTQGTRGLIVLAAIAVLTLLRLVKINFAWLAAAILFFAANTFALMVLRHYIPLDALVGHTNWNWGGKAAAIAVSILLVIGLAVFAKKPPREAGVTLAQKQGSFLPAALMTVLMVAAIIGLELVSHDGPSTDPERLWFQATMPGLDEELFWRGVFLLAMSEGIRSGRFNLLGAGINWAGVLISILFGLVHGLSFDKGALQFAPVTVAITGVLGFCLLWIRERTGSIALPIVAHNLINFVPSFF